MVCNVPMTVLDITQKVLAIFGFITVIMAVIRFLIDSKRRNFSSIMKKISVAKYSSMQKCFKEYKEENGDALVDSKALIIDKKWGYLGDKEKFKLIPLDSVKVVVHKDKPIAVNKSIDNPPAPQNFWYFIPRKAYVKELLKNNCAPKIFFNGKLYCASSFSSGENFDAPVLTVYEAEYFDFFNTCKVKEFMYEVGKRKFLKDDVLDLKNRACGIGINTLTVIRLEEATKNEKGEVIDNGLYFLMHQRGNKVAEGSGAVHVVPAGSFQAFTSFEQTEADIEAKLSSTVYREFCEEVLATSHMQELSSKKYLEHNDVYSFISNKEEKDVSKIFFLGLGLEPYNTKMEVLSLMYIDLQDNQRFNKFLALFEKRRENNGIEEKKTNNLVTKTKKDRLREALKYAGAEEGSIVLERLLDQTLEEYYGNMSITASAKELMYIAHCGLDQIRSL